MFIELRVSPSVSGTGPHFQLALPSPGSPRLGFPSFFGTTARSDFSTPVPRHFVSFGLRYHAASSCNAGSKDASCLRGVSVPVRGPVLSRGDVEISQVPGESTACMPCSATPTRPETPGRRDAPILPSEKETSSALVTDCFGAQSHGLHTRCLRFAAGIAPVPRKTRFRLGTSLFRVGLDTHGTPMKVSDLGHSFSFSKLCLAHLSCTFSGSLTG